MDLYPEMTKENTALVVIDVVNSCVADKCEDPSRNIHFKLIRNMVPKLEKFIQEFRNKIGATIIFTNNVPWQKEHLQENLNVLYTANPRASYYSVDTSEYPNQFYLVTPTKDDIVVTKNSYSAFVGTSLDEKLKDKGIKYLIMTGIFSDGCVLATIVDGFARGYNFIVLQDLVETTDSKTRQEIQSLLKQFTFPLMYGQTGDSFDFLKSWTDKKIIKSPPTPASI